MPKSNLPNPHLMALISIFVAQLIWAAANSVIKLTLQELPPFTFLFLRFWITSTVVLPYVILQLKKINVDRRDYLNIFLLGIFAQAAIIFVFLGLKYTTALDSAIIGILGPILAMFAGHYFYKEKIHPSVKLGVLIATIGTAIVVFEPAFSQIPITNGIPTHLRIMGNLFIVLYDLCFVLYIIWSKISLGQTNNIIKKTLHFIHLKPMKKDYPSNLLMSLTFFVGMVTMAPFAILENFGVFGKVNYSILNLSSTTVAGLLYMVFFSSIVAYFLFESALKKAKVVETALLSYLSPLMAMPFAFLLLNEMPSKVAIIGAVIIALGIVFAESKPQHKPLI